MSNLNGRIKRLEQQTGQTEKGLLVLWQDSDDESVFNDQAGNVYRKAPSGYTLIAANGERVTPIAIMNMDILKVVNDR